MPHPQTYSFLLAWALALSGCAPPDCAPNGLGAGLSGEPAARDWPQWRGPDRDAISPEAITVWPPVRLWQVGVGNGVSSVIACGGRVYAMGRAGDLDAVFCLDGETGREVWRHLYRSKGDHTSDVKLPGPRSTPATDGRRVYTMGLEGRLHCLDAPTGKVLWARGSDELGAHIGQYGVCCPLLLHGGMLVADVNKHCVALDKVTGREIWRAPGGGGWNGAAPVVLRAGGQECIVYGTGRCVLAASGRQVWHVPYNEWSVVTPVVWGERVFLAPFHGRNLGGKGCALIGTRGPGRPEVVWNNDEVEGLCSSAVAWKDHLYAPDRDDLAIRGESGLKMNVKCIDLRTGQVRWVQRPISWPNLLLAGGRLLIQTLKGDLILVDPSPASYKELGHTKLPRGRYWSYPALARGRLYCRSNRGEVTCLRVGAGARGHGGAPTGAVGARPMETFPFQQER